MTRDRARTAAVVGRTMLVLLWLGAVGSAGAVGLEWFLTIRARQAQADDPAPSRPRFDRIRRAYDRFAIKHLHPQYLFFFPLDPEERKALSNEVCSLDSDGFRGPGPSQAGGRRLAFLLGGSAAFGTYASSDSTTITGYLNRLQDDYFFVNAGVPAWNSTQELVRLAFEILDHRPALVLAYDGSNDADLLRDYETGGPGRSPVGSPGDFDRLMAMLNDAQARSGERASTSVLKLFFPELTRFLRKRRAGSAREADPPAAPISDRILQRGVAKYLANLTRMRDLTRAAGGRFVGVFQPVSLLHERVSPAFEHGLTDRDATVRFHAAVVQQRARDLEFFDLANVFDQYFAAIPVLDEQRDVSDETIFVDHVHLYDSGNRIVSQHLLRRLRLARRGLAHPLAQAPGRRASPAMPAAR